MRKGILILLTAQRFVYLTGDRTAVITAASAALLFDSGSAPQLVDGLFPNTLYFLATVALGKWIKFTFVAPKTVKEAKWYQSVSQTHGVWQWQGSNVAVPDDLTDLDWTDIGGNFTLGAGGTATTVQTVLNDNNVAYKHYRMKGVSGSVSALPYVFEIEFKQK